MPSIRSDYFTGNRDLLPEWLPDSSVFAKLLRCLMDNYLQDAVYVFHYPYLLPDHAYVLRKRGLSGNLNLTVGSSTVTVPITNRYTDVYDNPLPFAWYDGETLMVFNLHMGHATGGVPTVYNMDNVLRIPVNCTLVPLSDHRTGGRAYWNAGRGWRLIHLEPSGVYVPGSFSSIECYYEKRDPFPVVRLGNDVLERRSLWTRADDMIRLAGSHRHSMSSGAAYFHKIRCKLPGYPLFGLCSELGLSRVRTYVPVYKGYSFAPQDRNTFYFNDYLSTARRCRYPDVLQVADPFPEYGYASIYFLSSAWWDPAPVTTVGALSDEVT